MKLSRSWISDYVDCGGLSDEDLGRRLTEIGHAVESVEQHGDDAVFDLEITTNRVDAMSHRGMARELAAALGRDLLVSAPPPPEAQSGNAAVNIRIEVPEMCRRYTALAIRGVTIKPSPERIRRRLEAVGLRPINNVVDATNYAMMALGHPLHAFDLDKLGGPAIVVRAGKPNESMKSLDGEMRRLDGQTAVIADAQKPVALGGVIGGLESEITNATRNVLLECAWFTPSVVRRTARRLGLKTDASYRFERGVDANDTVEVARAAAALIVEIAGGVAEAPIDVVAVPTAPIHLTLRASRLSMASANVIGIGYALELFRRLGWNAEAVQEVLRVEVPTYRGDIHEEMDLIEEVLRFYGLNKIPSVLPRLTTGDVRREAIEVVQDHIRDLLAGSGLAEIVTYSFIRREFNDMFSNETPVEVTNALSENVASMRLSLLAGLLEAVAYNRSYGTRDGALFEVGRTFHRAGEKVSERGRAAIVMFGSVGTHWGDAKRTVDFFDAKGIVDLLAQRLHAPLEFRASDQPWMREGKRAAAWRGDRQVGSVGFISAEILQRFGIKGDVVAAEIDVEALTESAGEGRMQPVARYPGVPMILALTHGPQLEYQKLVETIRSFAVPHLHEVGLRDRFTPEDSNVTKTTLGMWYQAFDRSLTQEEVAALQQQLASRLAAALPVQIIT